MAEDVFGIVGTVQGGSFRVDEVVAEGGFAVIYRAYHGAFRSNVALKCLKIPRALSEAEQKEFLEKFREEAELLFRLSSAIPAVVRPLHVGTLSETSGLFVPFIALEWLEGRTLDGLISNRALEGQLPLDMVSAVRLLTPVADALCRAHRFPGPNGPVAIVHRDLKPENIFIANFHGKEVTRILDFGIAKVKSATSQMVGRQSAGESPMAAFTPAYGAPEQWLPKRYGQTGPWTDVWGIAITLVEAVCGHAPIDGDVAAMMGAAIDPDRRPTPRNEGVRVSDTVEAVMAQALAVDPRARFHDVGAFWNALSLAVGLPETVGDRSPSLAPPASSAAVAGTARTQVAPFAPSSQNSGDVPDLVLRPAAVRAPPPQETAREAPAPVAAKVHPGLRAAAIDPSSFYGGSSFDSLDDDAPRLRIQTDAGYQPPAAARVGFEPSRGAVPFPSEPGSAHRKLDVAGPLKLLGGSVLLMAADYGYAAATGEVLQLGPARMLWLAGPMAGVGAILLLVRFMAATE